MSFISRIACSLTLTVATIALSACATRPTIQNVTPYDTIGIVSKIRCETRAAIWIKTVEYLRSKQKTGSTPEELLLRLEKGPDHEADGWTNRDIKIEELPIAYQKSLRTFSKAAVVYDFQFDMTIQNDFGTSIGWLYPVRGDTFLGNFTGDSKNKRANKRNFRIEDDFETLIRKPGIDCQSIYGDGGSYHTKRRIKFPITGDLGIDEIVGTFWYLANYSRLIGLGSTAISSRYDEDSKYGRLVDEITFTTLLSGSLNPEYRQTGTERVLRLTPVTVSALASREDVHKLIIAFAMPTSDLDRATAVGSGRAAAEAVDATLLRRDAEILDALRSR